MAKDTVFASPQQHIAGFSFNDAVASVFSDMISRSVPGYDLTLEMLAVISQRYTLPKTHCYDIGSSLGASSLSLARNAAKDCEIVGIDNSPAMIKRANALLNETDFDNVRYFEGDACEYDFKPASVISSNFTLQFIPLEKRAPLLAKLCDSLVEGGVFVLSEKVTFEDSHHSDTMIDLYHRFKAGRGYSELEIAQKRTALENVLIPETIEQHKQHLLDAGFRDVMVWFQCFNFCSLIAFK